MSFLDQRQIIELGAFALLADQQVRSDLVHGILRDENDYTSNFTATLRRAINTHSRTGLTATSFLLPTTVERDTGTDATIILQNGRHMKVILFEAKWPRFEKPNYRWDRWHDGKHTLSHFSDQLERQKKMTHCAVFEMFYQGFPAGKQPRYLHRHNSSCVWHSDAIAFRDSRPDPNAIWDQLDVAEMLKGNRHTIGDMLLEVGLCRKGKPFTMAQPEGLAHELGLQGFVLAIQGKSQNAD